MLQNENNLVYILLGWGFLFVFFILPIIMAIKIPKNKRKKEFNKKLINGEKIFCQRCNKEIKNYEGSNGYSLCVECDPKPKDIKEWWEKTDDGVKIIVEFAVSIFIIIPLIIFIFLFLKNNGIIGMVIGLFILFKNFLFSGFWQALLCFLISLILPTYVYKINYGLETKPQITVFIFSACISLFMFLVFIISLIKYLWSVIN